MNARVKEVPDKGKIARPSDQKKSGDPPKKEAPDENETQAPPPLTLQELRQRRRKLLILRLIAWVGGPTLISVIYFTVIASDQFQSTAQFAVHSAESTSPVGLELLMGPSGGGASVHDTLSVRDYILSRDMLARLETEHDFREHYEDSNNDIWTRLKHGADNEERFDYYLSKIDVTHDTLSGNLTVALRAYSPEAAQRFSNAIIGYSEEMVNRLSERARTDQMAFAKQQVAEAEERLAKSSEALAELQAERAEFDPQQSAAAVVGIRSELEIEVAKARAELSQLSAVFQSDAPKVREARRRVQALKTQIDAENERLVDVDPDRGPDKTLSASLVDFQQAALEQEFARAAYQSALTSIEMARAAASKQQRYLAPIARPSRPDAPTHPEKLFGILTVLFSSFAAFGIFSLLSASVREHARL